MINLLRFFRKFAVIIAAGGVLSCTQTSALQDAEQMIDNILSSIKKKSDLCSTNAARSVFFTFLVDLLTDNDCESIASKQGKIECFFPSAQSILLDRINVVYKRLVCSTSGKPIVVFKTLPNTALLPLLNTQQSRTLVAIFPGILSETPIGILSLIAKRGPVYENNGCYFFNLIVTCSFTKKNKLPVIMFWRNDGTYTNTVDFVFRYQLFPATSSMQATELAVESNRVLSADEISRSLKGKVTIYGNVQLSPVEFTESVWNRETVLLPSRNSVPIRQIDLETITNWYWDAIGESVINFPQCIDRKLLLFEPARPVLRAGQSFATTDQPGTLFVSRLALHPASKAQPIQVQGKFHMSIVSQQRTANIKRKPNRNGVLSTLCLKKQKTSNQQSLPPLSLPKDAFPALTIHRVPSDGDCGYAALGITRTSLANTLCDYLSQHTDPSDPIRTEVQRQMDDLQQNIKDFLNSNGGTTIENYIKWFLKRTAENFVNCFEVRAVNASGNINQLRNYLDLGNGEIVYTGNQDALTVEDRTQHGIGTVIATFLRHPIYIATHENGMVIEIRRFVPLQGNFPTFDTARTDFNTDGPLWLAIEHGDAHINQASPSGL
jgi:hypothetical protein